MNPAKGWGLTEEEREDKIISPLTETERKRLTNLEGVIHDTVARFVEAGRALDEIRDAQLYRDVEPPTFKAYCDQVWGLGERRAYQLIDAAKTVAATAPMVQPPPNERIARELIPILHSEGDRAVAEAWAKVLKRLDGSNRRVTANETRAVLLDEGYIADTRGGGSGKPNLTIQAGEIGDKILAVRKRLRRYAERDVVGHLPLVDRTKGKLAEYAQWCDGLRIGLRELAAGRELPHGEELEELLEGGK